MTLSRKNPSAIYSGPPEGSVYGPVAFPASMVLPDAIPKFRIKLCLVERSLSGYLNPETHLRAAAERPLLTAAKQIRLEASYLRTPMVAHR